MLVWCVVNVQDWRVTSTYWTGVLYVLDWCVACTGLVCMYWTDVLYVLDWCVGLMYRKFWTSLFYVLDWCVHKNIGVLSVLLYALDEYVVGVMYLMDCSVALWSLGSRNNDTKYSDYGWVCLTSS